MPTSSSSILGEQTFYQLCAVLKMGQQLIPSDPDRRPIEKAFRKAALKTHPDKVFNKCICRTYLIIIKSGKNI